MMYPANAKDWPEFLVYEYDFRTELVNMADAITKLELWDWMKDDNPPKDTGYMFWRHENIDKISNTIVNNGHSGATFGYALRIMQFIAKNGFDAGEKKTNHNNNERKKVKK